MSVGTSVARTFTVKNTGKAKTGALSDTLGGPNASQFIKTTDGCAKHSLAGGATCPITVAFSPTLVGSAAATLTVFGKPGGSVAASLTGTGLAPAHLTVTPVAHEFGSVLVGVELRQEFVVTNTGDEAVIGPMSQAITGEDADDFLIWSTQCGGLSLAGGASCTITVAFSPKSSGAKTAALTVRGIPVGGTASASLTGTGLAPANLVISPDEHGYGGVLVGDTSSEQAFIITNTGDQASGALSASVGGAEPDEFQVKTDTCSSTSLSVDATCSVSVVFAPSSGGAKIATLDVSASPGGIAAASLTGIGLAPANLIITPPAHTYGSVSVGSTSYEQTFTITNTGDQPSGPLSESLSGVDPGQFQITSSGTCGSSSLAAGEGCTLAATFNPTSSGAKSATLDLSAAPGGTASASLSGSGASPPANLVVSPGTDATFGSVNVGQSGGDQTFTVSNSGAADTGVVSVTLGNLDPTQFTITSNTCGTALSPSATCAFNIAFSPSSWGGKFAVVTVAATPGGAVERGLSGTATLPPGSPTPTIALGPPGANFGQVAIGTTAGPVPFVVQNTTSSPLGVGVDLTQFAGSAFHIVTLLNSCGPLGLPPGGSCFVYVTAAPTFIGWQSAHLTVQDPNGTGWTAALAVYGH